MAYTFEEKKDLICHVVTNLFSQATNGVELLALVKQYFILTEIKTALQIKLTAMNLGIDSTIVDYETDKQNNLEFNNEIDSIV